MNVLFLTDGYKLDHRRQYPKGIEYIQANWTPRSNNHYPEAKDGVVVFGITYTLNKIYEEFDKFFNSEESSEEYMNFVDSYLGPNEVGGEHIKELHKYGKLPLSFKYLPEGELCPIGVPALVVENTEPKFFWLVNYIETLLSNMLWLPMTSATTARLYKKNLKEHCENVGIALNPFLCHDFSMRGMAGLDSAILSGMGHLTSFEGSESIPAIVEIKKYYTDENENYFIAGTIPATEHSVMCAGSKEDEYETYRRLITEVYPRGFVSIVSDTWDLWKVLTDYSVKLKNIILNREGRVVFRPDSGDPVEIICGKTVREEKYISYEDWYDDKYNLGENNKVGDLIKLDDVIYEVTKIKDRYQAGEEYPIIFDMVDELKPVSEEYLQSPEFKGAYEILLDTFGYTLSSNGYKILNEKVGLIYGDSITLERQKEIYKRLEEKGISASNLVLGIGSFTYQYKTRDSLGFAMKSTWCQINGESKSIFKNPITDNGTKKSATGKVDVIRVNGKLVLKDDNNYTNNTEKSELIEFDRINKPSLKEIREKINKTL